MGFTVQLPGEIDTQVYALARDRKTTKSSIVIEAVRKYLEDERQTFATIGIQPKENQNERPNISDSVNGSGRTR